MPDDSSTTGTGAEAPPIRQSPAALLHFIANEARAIRSTAALLTGFLELGDAAGTAYAVELITVRSRALSDAHAMLRSLEADHG